MGATVDVSRLVDVKEADATVDTKEAGAGACG